MSENITLGVKPNTGAQRDAIHVAVIPMEADVFLRPGDRVGVKDGKATPYCKPVGIVDPFLKDGVSPGEAFYLCLFPNSVTGMRHHWQHPDFENATNDPDFENATNENKVNDDRQRLKELCALFDFDFDEVINGDSWITNGGWESTSESMRNDWCSVRDEFFSLYEKLTGIHVNVDNQGFFSCSC